MVCRRFFSWLLTIAISIVLSSTAYPFQDSSEALLQEETEDYYERWLKEDVLYIITDEEEDVFFNLTTDAEREEFIEQFWFRRDPNPRTAENEFKEEHYRRIAYANEHFASGDPGWLTDRGRVYIIHGPPDNIESRPSGGFYQREIGEGGGVTATYPFERWRYRYIEGLGNDVLLEFVDSTFTGKYELAVFPWEKDALMQFPGAGRTLAEQTGLGSRADRPGFIPGAGVHGGSNPNLMYRRLRDMPFYRYELAAKIQAPKPIKYLDLKELVEVHVGFENLPFEMEEEYFRLNDQQVLIPLTLKVRNKDLTFKPKGDQQVAKLAIYGIVTSMTNRIVMEFEDDVIASFKDDRMEIGLQKSSIYQKIIPLDRKYRYRLDLVLKDLNGGKVGVVQRALIPPAFPQDSLAGSTLVISDYIQSLDSVPRAEEMFVLGDVKIRPNIHKVFSQRMPLGVYFQIYNAAIDQSSLSPSLKVEYRLHKDGELLRAAVDQNGESTQFFSDRRVVLIKQLSLQGLEPGDYQIELEVTDQLTSQSLKTSEEFRVVDENKLALNYSR